MRVIVILFLLGTVNLFAQEALPATGGEGSGAGGSFSYTVGQIAYTTNTSASGTLNEGVQQTYTVLDSTDGLNELLLDLEMKVYPNPSTDLVNLEIADLDSDELTITVSDANQKLLLSKIVLNAKESIDFSIYASGTYILEVSDGSGRTKVFKIIKQ